MSKKINNTPRLRFPEFTGEWVEKKLGELLTYEQPTPYLVTNTNYKKSGIPVLTAGKTFILGYTDETHGVYDNLPVIIFDDFVTESKFVDFPFKVKSSAMKMLKLLDENNNLHLIYELMQLLQYPVKEHKRYWISEYSRLTIPLPPSPAEQQKIASCLSAMDDLIAAQAEKVEALKEKKTGMMQQLFPQHGETTPRLRFPEFTGEWEEKTLEEVCQPITPLLKIQSRDYLSAGKFPIVDQSQSLICGWTNEDTGLMQQPPYIIFGDHTCVLKYVNFPFVQGADGVKILSPKKGYMPQFIYQTFVSNPLKQDGYKRHYTDFKEKLFFFPPTPAEQKKIADCLSELDTLIAAETAQLESLKDHKKGLMQQLFPQPAK